MDKISPELEQEFVFAASELVDAVTESDTELMQLHAEALTAWKDNKTQREKQAAVDAIFARKIQLIKLFIEGQKKCLN